MLTVGSSSNGSLELSDGTIFTWDSSKEISPEEMDRRVALLSMNPPKIIARNRSPEDMVGEMDWITPLWKRVTFSQERDEENRATIFFFQILGDQFKPVHQLLTMEERDYNRNPMVSIQPEIIATKLKFLLHRIFEQFSKTPSDPNCQTLFSRIVDLKFDGYSLKFLPEEVGFFKNLKTLKLENCNLKKLPYSIGNLTELQELNLVGNGLTALPDTLTNCSKLFAVRGLSNQLPYSKLIQYAKNFFEKSNVAVAVNLIHQSIQASHIQSDFLSSDSYSEAIDLIKQIVGDVGDMTSSEEISCMLREISIELAQKDKNIALEVASLIPLANVRTLALSDLENGSNGD